MPFVTTKVGQFCSFLSRRTSFQHLSRVHTNNQVRTSLSSVSCSVVSLPSSRRSFYFRSIGKTENIGLCGQRSSCVNHQVSPESLKFFCVRTPEESKNSASSTASVEMVRPDIPKNKASAVIEDNYWYTDAKACSMPRYSCTRASVRSPFARSRRSVERVLRYRLLCGERVLQVP